MASSSFDSSVTSTSAPVLDSATDSAGLTVDQLIAASGLGSSDPTVAGVAIEALDRSLGTWQYRLSGSTTWLTIDVGLLNSQTNSLALLLGAQDAIRLLSYGDLTGSLADAISLRSWDQTVGQAGDYWIAAAGSDGFGSETATLGVSVTGINDAPSFSALTGTGRRMLPIGSSTDEAFSVVVQPDGKIIAAGWAYNGSNDDFALARLNPNGSIDNTFDGDGKRFVPIGSGMDRARSLVLQADGKILVAGLTHNGTDLDFALARLTTDGAIDASFGSNGVIALPIGLSNDEANSVIVAPDGCIIVIGQAHNGTNEDFAIARLLADGSLDASFGVEGMLTLPIGPGLDQARSVVLQADGKLVVVGRSWNGTNDDFSIVRLNSDGSLDTTFDTDGKILLPIGTNADDASSVVVQADGKILIAGSTWNGASYDFALVRLNANGSLDTSFDADGKRILPIGTSRDEARSVVLQDDGKILIAGRAWNGLNYDFAIARLNADGSLDTSFDADGKRTLPVGTNWDEAQSVTVQPDGKIVLAGRAWNGTSYDFAFVRLNPDGSLDASFNGTSSHTLGNSASFTENGAAVALDTSVSVIDPELAALAAWAGDYGGASITIERQGGASAEDVFSGRGNLVLADDLAVLSGVTVGSVTSTEGSLNISFASGATQAQVNAVLSSIAYANTNDLPPASVTLVWTFSDGNAGAQGTEGPLLATGTSTVRITAANDAPTGQVLIEGIAAEHETLYADTSTLQDPEGLGVLSYQWQANGQNIAGANTDTLVLSSEQIGQSIRVQVRYTDGLGSQERVSSASTAAVVNTNDGPTGQVMIEGEPAQGETLSLDTHAIEDLDGLGAFAYQWLADGQEIDGATDDTLVLSQAHVGQRISVVVNYTDAFGSFEFVLSDETAPVVNRNDACLGSVSIDGLPIQDETLTANTDSLQDGDGLGELSYQWQADGVDIDGATEACLLLSQDLVGQRITVVVQYTDGFGTTETLVSEPTDKVENLNDEVLGSVQIDGTALQGQTLSVNTEALDDVDGLGSLSYQWQADGEDIDGATDSTLVLSQDQVGRAITVVVRYTDALGTSESVTSEATDPVANLDDAPVGDIRIRGEVAQYETLSVDIDAVQDLDGLGEFGYQWHADGTDIEGATQSTLVLTQAQVGQQISVTVTYTDGHGHAEMLVANATEAVQNINDDVLVNESLTDRSVDEDGEFSFDIPSGTFSDADGEDTLTLSATLPDGSPLPDWLSFDADDHSFSGTPSNEDVGELVVRVHAVDDHGVSAYVDFTLEVLNTNDAPTRDAALQNQNATAEARFSVTIPEDAFDDVDIDDALSFTVTLDDGSDLPGWLSFDAESLTLSGTPDYSDIGVLQLRVTASDRDGESAYSDFAVTVIAPPGRWIEGTAGADSLVGSRSGDTLLGWEGDDQLFGNDGDDLLNGGAGADQMAGGKGNDIYLVDAATDLIVEYADQGFDSVQTIRTSFTLPNEVEALVYTGSAAFTGTGNASANMFLGGNGADRLFGLAGEDSLMGGAGADTLTGGQGADELTGGAGADRFVYTALTDSGTLASSRDRITDFTRGSDRIDLSAIDANVTVSGNQAFVWRGVSEFNGAGQLRMWYDASIDQTVLEATTDARLSTIEFSLALIGDHTQGANALKAIDIVL